MLVGVRVLVSVVMRMRMCVAVLMRMGMFMGFGRGSFMCEHIDFGGCQPATDHLARCDARADIQGRCRFGKYRNRNAGIDHGAEQHVAADAGKAVQVGNTH